MERIKVSWRARVAHQVQSGVSVFAKGESFAPLDIHEGGQNKNAVRPTLVNMNCVKSLGEGMYEKTFDPRDLLRNKRHPFLPEVCAECYFTHRNTSGPLRPDCIILDDYRKKRPL